MATNGSRNAAASSQALKVGAQMPIERRERLADAGGGAVQPAQLGVGPHGADERDADERPDQRAAAPTTAREASSSRHSFSSSQQPKAAYVSARNTSSRSRAAAGAARCRERRELVERAFAADAAAAQQHEAIADARGVGDLVDREEQRAAAARRSARSVARDVARLPQVEAVERLVGEQQRLRRQQADRQQRALALALRQRADRRVEQRREVEPARSRRRAGRASAAEEADA